MTDQKHCHTLRISQRLLSRRALLRSIAGAAASLPVAGLLAACGADAEDGTESVATPTTASVATSATPTDSEAEPIPEIEVIEETSDERVIRHALGETTIPINPTRIVALNASITDSLLALNIQPAGIATFTGHDFTSYTYLEADLQNIPIVGTFVEPNLEAILAVEPDLILITADYDPEMYDQLHRIAPTVAIPNHGSFRAWLPDIGTILGIDAEAEARIGEYEAKAAEAQAALDAAASEETVAFLRVYPDEYQVYGNARLVGPIIYGDLGLEPDPLVRELAWEENAVVISNERIPDFTADHIFLLDQSQGTETDGDIAALTDDPLWQATPAVQNGNVYQAERGIWINAGVIAAERVIDVVLDAMGGE